MAGSPYLVLALMVLGGAALYGIGTLLVRSANHEVPAEPIPSTQMVAWANAVTGTDDALDTATRIDIIERLVLVGEPWCIDVIRAAAETENDAPVRDAAARALHALR